LANLKKSGKPLLQNSLAKAELLRPTFATNEVRFLPLDDYKPLRLEEQQWVKTQTLVPIFVLEWW
jgi:hypothetical protein